MRPWQRTQNQHQKPLQAYQEAKAKELRSASITSGAFAQLEGWIDDLQEADTTALRQQLEAFKKMVFKMLNGKKKTVEAGVDDDEDEDMKESSKVQVVPSAQNKAGVAPKSKNAKALLKGTGNEKSVGSATATAKLILSKRFGS